MVSKMKISIDNTYIRLLIYFFLLLILFFTLLIIYTNISPTKKANNNLTSENESIDEPASEAIGNGINIVIDPGHGGFDPGKVSADGINEKDINLQIAILLRDLLIDLGYNVYMTRDTDISLYDEGASSKKMSDLNNRTALAAEYSADLFISIHQNSFSDTRVHGAQTFYYADSSDGKRLAGIIQEHIKSTVDTDNTREIKGNNEYVILAGSPCTAVIVECGFLSCPEEASLLVSDDYQQLIAEAIASAVEEYYGR